MPATPPLFNTAYVEVNDNKLSNVGCFVRADNAKPFFTMATIFAANINGNDPNQPTIYFNPNVDYLLNHTNQVANLQQRGIKVLLTLLGNHENAGWACMTDQMAIQDFAARVVAMVKQYNLDGIDIDDEYSTCLANDTSLVRIAEAIKKNPDFKGRLLTKALFLDGAYFTAVYDGHTLADFLDYGWEMSYFSGDFPARLNTYVGYHMLKSKLALGVSNGARDPAASEATTFIKQSGFGGMMVYNVKNTSRDYLTQIAQTEYGTAVNTIPNCLAD